MEHYKSIFLGSSPLFLLYHKLLNQKEGNSLLIEKEDRVGGAWYTSEMWGIKNLELGCHILKNIPEGIELMKKLGVPLKEMEQQPSLLITKFDGESKLNTLKNSSLKILKTLSKNKLYNKYKIGKLENIAKNKELCKYHYLDQGCYEMIQSLDNDKVNIKRDQKVKAIRIVDKKAQVVMSDNSVVSTDQLFLPKNFHLDSLDIKGELIEFEYTKYIAEHYIFRFSKKINTFSFIDVLGDELINLISNVGLYCDSGDNTILAIAVKKPTGRSENNLEIASFDGFPNEAEQIKIKDTLLNKLKAFNLINESDELMDFHYEPYLLNVRKDKNKYDIEKSSKQIIRLLDTTDLVESLLINQMPNVD